MKIQYCSNLHIEFHENLRFMKSLPLEPVDDTLSYVPWGGDNQMPFDLSRLYGLKYGIGESLYIKNHRPYGFEILRNALLKLTKIWMSPKNDESRP